MDLSERTASTTRHPWELARAGFLLDVLDDAGVLRQARAILDVGSGDAWFATQLLSRCAAEVTCWDLHFDDDDLLRLRTRARLTPVRTAPPGPFDVALMLDVIEHVDDDDAFVDDVLSRVQPGARVLVSVPAWPRLFSSHDRSLQHRRRYTPAGCRAVLRRAGLRIDRSGGFFHTLLLPRALAVVVEGLRAPAAGAGIGSWRHGPLLTQGIAAAFGLEQRLSRAAADAGVDVPGLSFFALCTREPR